MIILGLQNNMDSYKLQQLVRDEKGALVQKTTDILTAFVFQNGRSLVYIPITKYDLDAQPYIVLSEIIASANNNTRCILRKTSEGTKIVALGAIVVTN